MSKKLFHRPQNRSGCLNGNWKGGGATLICVRCSKQFFVKHPRVGKAKYCSLTCFNLFQKESGIDWHFAKHGKKCVVRSIYKGTRLKEYVSIQCRQCGALFEVRPGSVKTKHFCSKQCSLVWRSWRHSGERNSAWRGGVSCHPYPYNWNAISDQIMKRDAMKCQNPHCNNSCKHLDVHHIDYDKANCSSENLITLCDTCHSQTHHNRMKWLAYYKQLHKERGFNVSAMVDVPRLNRIKQGWNRGEKHPLSKLSDKDVEIIRSQLRGSIRGMARTLSAKFGVSESLISMIKNGVIRGIPK